MAAAVLTVYTSLPKDSPSAARSLRTCKADESESESES